MPNESSGGKIAFTSGYFSSFDWKSTRFFCFYATVNTDKFHLVSYYFDLKEREEAVMKCRVIDRGRNPRIVDAAGTWLASYRWQLFVTLTFAVDRVSSERAKKLFEQFAQASGKNVIYFLVVEWHKFRDNVHIHALLGGVENELNWKYGISRVLRYDSKLGARFYLSKFIGSEMVEWDFKLDSMQKERDY
jgi:hypothetical protein